MLEIYEYINNNLTLDLKTGIFYWKTPPKFHSDLIGKIAGNKQKNLNNKFYWVIKINNKKYKRARLVFLYLNKRFPKNCIDHINGNSLDDRPENIREATVTQNAWNHKGRKKTSNLPMGIRFQSGKYVARISCNKNQITIGKYENLEDAHKAYINKRKELFGDYCGY
jgi:hypothetical protein